MSYFDVSGVLGYPGIKESFTLHHITGTVMDDRGDTTDTTVDYVLSGSVQVVALNDVDRSEGRLQDGDLQIFVSSRETYSSFIEMDDTLTWDSLVYRIVSYIKNPGHYELIARRY